ncbi:UNKNOWN [Stylonychia lemnae]|uniref:Uncharacterized protein n=1 Tax=Stylonychia lemnae TaxID=5949 RepID=A0A078B6K6_STYLE|nr:UNKNOWN [Stylonychia lemnae]|eukprot:CDW90165.1 UNKNOWN [Stylonychia lemnae]
MIPTSTDIQEARIELRWEHQIKVAVTIAQSPSRVAQPIKRKINKLKQQIRGNDDIKSVMESKKSLIDKYYPTPSMMRGDNAYDNSAQTSQIHSKSSMTRVNPKVRKILVNQQNPYSRSGQSEQQSQSYSMMNTPGKRSQLNSNSKRRILTSKTLIKNINTNGNTTNNDTSLDLSTIRRQKKIRIQSKNIVGINSSMQILTTQKQNEKIAMIKNQSQRQRYKKLLQEFNYQRDLIIQDYQNSKIIVCEFLNNHMSTDAQVQQVKNSEQIMQKIVTFIILGQYDQEKDIDLSQPISLIVENMILKIMDQNPMEIIELDRYRETPKLLLNNQAAKYIQMNPKYHRKVASFQIQSFNQNDVGQNNATPNSYSNQLSNHSQSPHNSYSYTNMYRNLASNFKHTTGGEVDHQKRFQILKNYINRQQSLNSQMKNFNKKTIHLTHHQDVIGGKSKFKKSRDILQGHGQNQGQIQGQNRSHFKNRSNVNVLSKVLSNDSERNNENKGGTLFDHTAFDQTIQINRTFESTMKAPSQDNNLLKLTMVPDASVMRLINRQESPNILRQTPSRDKLLKDAELMKNQILIESIIRDRDRQVIEPRTGERKVFYNHFNI